MIVTTKDKHGNAFFRASNSKIFFFFKLIHKKQIYTCDSSCDSEGNCSMGEDRGQHQVFNPPGIAPTPQGTRKAAVLAT